MSPKQKKIAIAAGLLISCLLMIYLLINTKTHEDVTLEDLAVIDSLIVNELSSYSIKNKQIKSKTVKTGDFKRVNYEVRIPGKLSKTQIHTDIHYKLNELGISTPAKLKLPERDLNIFVYVDGTVIRSIQLVTDTTFKTTDFSSSLVFVTDHSPSAALVERVRDIGEFTPLVFRTLEPEIAQKWYKSTSEIIKPIYVWVNESNREDVIKSTVWLKDKLPQFQSISRSITTWIDVNSASKADAQTQFYRNYNLRGLQMDASVFLDAEEGIYAYEQALRKFKQLAVQDIHPILLVELNDKSVSVMEERVVELKKYGLSFHPPVFRNF
ncbi:hypothetical protein EP331_11105 [bacterium]|nr:MAG: hypothetical protein EP331_11105 [bacterium]